MSGVFINLHLIIFWSGRLRICIRRLWYLRSRFQLMWNLISVVVYPSPKISNISIQFLWRKKKVTWETMRERKITLTVKKAENIYFRSNISIILFLILIYSKIRSLIEDSLGEIVNIKFVILLLVEVKSIFILLYYVKCILVLSFSCWYSFCHNLYCCGEFFIVAIVFKLKNFVIRFLIFKARMSII